MSGCCCIPKALRAAADPAVAGAGTGNLGGRVSSVREHGASVERVCWLLTCWHGQMASVAARSNVARRRVSNWSRRGAGTGVVVYCMDAALDVSFLRDVFLTGQDNVWASSGVDSRPQCRLAINEVKRQKHRDAASRGQLASIWGHASRCIVATRTVPTTSTEFLDCMS